VWQFDQESLTITLRDSSGKDLYDVDLVRCRTSAEVLDRVCQVAGKRWATREQLGSLIRTLNAILRPQQTLCGCGVERGPIDVRRLVERSA
jgi:hypothetical protein